MMPGSYMRLALLLPALLMLTSVVGCMNPVAYGDGVKGLYSKEYTPLNRVGSIGVFPRFLKYSEGGVPVSRLWITELKKETDIRVTHISVPAGMLQREFIEGLKNRNIHEIVSDEEVPEAFLTGEVIESEYVLAPLRGWYKKYVMKVVLYNRSGDKLWEASVSNSDYLETQKYNTVHILAKALAAKIKNRQLY